MAGPFTYPVAGSTPFDGTEKVDGTPISPTFDAENVRDGIIEARQTAPGKARSSINLQHNGTMSNSFWHGYQSTISSNTTPIVIPWNCILKEYTFSADRTSMDGRMDFYLNGTGGGDIIYSIQFNNVNRTLVDFPELTFVSGDLLRLRWVDQGQNPRDVSSVLFFILTDNT